MGRQLGFTQHTDMRVVHIKQKSAVKFLRLNILGIKQNGLDFVAWYWMRSAESANIHGVRYELFWQFPIKSLSVRHEKFLVTQF